MKDKLREARKKGFDPLKEAFIVDCDSTVSRSSQSHNCSPCITCGRGNGHWVTNRGRRLLKEEMMRLQGMDPTQFTVAVAENQLGKQLGNTMSVNVLERLFTRLLPAAKLVRSQTLKDRWANGQAVKKLSATRGKGFKGLSAKLKKANADGARGTKMSSMLLEACSSKKRCSTSLAGGGAEKRVRI